MNIGFETGGGVFRTAAATVLLAAFGVAAATSAAEEGDAEVAIEELRRLLASEDAADLQRAAERLAADDVAATALLVELALAPWHAELEKVLHATLERAPQAPLLELIRHEPRRQEWVLAAIHRRIGATGEALAIDRRAASDAVAAHALATQHMQARIEALRYWRMMAGPEIAPPLALIELVYDVMLGDPTPPDPTLKMAVSPQDAGAELLALVVGDKDRDDEERLLALLADDDPALRLGAVKVFALGGPPSAEAADRLLERLPVETDPAVLNVLPDALNQLASRCDDAGRVLIDALDGPANAGGSAARALCYLAGRLSPELQSAVADAMLDQQGKKDGTPARWALATLRSLMPVLAEDQQRRLVAGLLPHAEVDDAQRDHRLGAIAAAGPAGEAAIPLLQELVAASGEGEDRARLAGDLWQVERDPSAVLDIFRQAIASDDSVERHYGLEGLELMGEHAAPAIGDLVALLSSPRSGTRMSVLRCLETFGPVAKGALPALHEHSAAKGSAEQEALNAAILAIEAKG